MHLLLLVATAELAFNRLASRELRPAGVEGVPWWHVLLDHVGLFFQYFASTLAIGIVARELWRLRRPSAPYGATSRWGVIVFGAVFLVLAAVNIATRPDAQGSFLFETAYVAVLVALVAAQLSASSGAAVKVGMLVLIMPLVIPYYGPVAVRIMHDAEAAWGDLPERVRLIGQGAMICAALVSPYCFAPRPFASAAGRLGPLVVAVFVSAVGVLILRQHYEVGMRLAHHGLGIDIGPGAPVALLAVCLVALATMTWTVTACLGAEAEARRDIGVGLALVVVSGYGFAWPQQYLVGVAGVFVIGLAATRVRREERAYATVARAGFHAPPIAGEVWTRYLDALIQAVEARSARELELSVRRSTPGTDDVGEPPRASDEDATTSLSWRLGRAYMVLDLAREQGVLVRLDVFCGLTTPRTREPDWTLYALPEKLLGIGAHPKPPFTSVPVVRVDDAAFDQRFRVRDRGGMSARLMDDGLRARTTALIDGWMAYWDGAGLRYRVCPGAGAPLDHPIPVTELAFRGEGSMPSPERLVTVLELIMDIAERALGDRNDTGTEPETTAAAKTETTAAVEPEPEPTAAAAAEPERGES